MDTLQELMIELSLQELILDQQFLLELVQKLSRTLTRLQNAFDKKGADRASFFSNGINTETKGVDVVITHKYDFGNGVSIKSDLAGSYNHTQRVGKLTLPETLINSGTNAAAYEFTFFPESSKVYLENAIPRFKASLANTFTFGKLDILLRNSYFGKVTEPGSTDVNLDGSSSIYEHPVYGGKLITDLSLSYQYNKNLRFTVGANNIGDVYPDLNPTTVPSFTNTTPGLSLLRQVQTCLTQTNLCILEQYHNLA